MPCFVLRALFPCGVYTCISRTRRGVEQYMDRPRLTPLAIRSVHGKADGNAKRVPAHWGWLPGDRAAPEEP